MRFCRFVVWNIHIVVFLSHLCFLIIIDVLIVTLLDLFLVTVISLSLFFFCVVFEFSYWFIYSIFNVGESSSYLLFLDTCCLSMSSLECRALCIVIIFLVLWSICWSCPLVHFKNSPEYLTRRCNIMAEGFRFMPLGLVGLTTFRGSAWVT